VFNVNSFVRCCDVPKIPGDSEPIPNRQDPSFLRGQKRAGKRQWTV